MPKRPRTLAAVLRAMPGEPTKADVAGHAGLVDALRAAYARGWSTQALARVIGDDLKQAGYPPITAQDVAAWVGAPQTVIDRTEPSQGPQG